MAKLGLCACYGNHNFGSVLQALATCRALEQLDVDYELIRYQKSLSAKRLAQIARKAFARDAWIGLASDVGWRRYLSKNPELQLKIAARDVRFSSYIDEKFPRLSPVLRGYDELCSYSHVYSSVMVGSDQLWLPSGFSSRFYTLEFCAPEVRRLSYATSFGVASLSARDTRRARQFLERIERIGVREESGAAIVSNALGYDAAEVVVDPTLLFDAEGWSDISESKTLIDEPYILCYFLGKRERPREVARLLRDATGCSVAMLRDWGFHLAIDDETADFSLYDTDPGDFINLIRNAQYVLTDSFHGSVFSLLHHKKFVSFYRDEEGGNSRNTRLDSLFSKCGGGVSVCESEDISEILEKSIDYGEVDANLSEWRKRSWSFLEGAVHGC